MGTKTKRTAFLVSISMCLGVGCASDHHPAPKPDGGEVNCMLDPRVDTYVANLGKSSSSGTVNVTLISSKPAPPAKGNNTWKIRVTGAGGAPISDPALGVDLFMPDHGHGTPVTPVVTSQPDGVYDITPLNLFMAGVWRITIAPPGASADAVQFFFCIMG